MDSVVTQRRRLTVADSLWVAWSVSRSGDWVEGLRRNTWRTYVWTGRRAQRSLSYLLFIGPDLSRPAGRWVSQAALWPSDWTRASVSRLWHRCGQWRNQKCKLRERELASLNLSSLFFPILHFFSLFNLLFPFFPLFMPCKLVYQFVSVYFVFFVFMSCDFDGPSFSRPSLSVLLYRLLWFRVTIPRITVNDLSVVGVAYLTRLRPTVWFYTLLTDMKTIRAEFEVAAPLVDNSYNKLTVCRPSVCITSWPCDLDTELCWMLSLCVYPLLALAQKCGPRGAARMQMHHHPVSHTRLSSCTS